MREEGLKCGKIPLDLLEEIIGLLDLDDERIIVGPRVGEDAAVVRWNGRLLVAASDPITFASELLGWYAVMVNANDISVMGAIPRYLLITLLLPPYSPPSLPIEIMKQVEDACRLFSIKVIGGHSEVTPGLDRPIAIGTMLGEAEKVVTPSAKEGDLIYITKGIAIEGTALLAREYAPQLLSLGIKEETIERAKRMIFEPGIAVVKEALLLRDYVSSMHDPTEGGLSSAIYELCRANEKGALIYEESIPILPECRLICERLSLNPLGLLASGALLFTVPPQNKGKVKELLEKEGIFYGEIGEVKERDYGIKIKRGEKIYPLDYFARDEVARLEEEWGR
ncbi:MAG: AIR synthase-related protein [bacterium]